MVIISFLLTIILIGLFTFVRSLERHSKMEKRLNSFAALEDGAIEDKEQLKPVRKVKIGKLRGYFSKAVSSQKEEQIQRKLLQAGNPFNMTVTDFDMINNILRVAVPLLFGGYAILLGSNIAKIFILMLVGFLLSFKALNLYMNSKIKNRFKKALRELPDFLDLLTISVEAGLGFDTALNKIIAKRSGVLSSEFFIYLEEMRLGKAKKKPLLELRRG